MSPNTRERGIALIGVVLTLALLMGLVATMAVSLNMDTQLRGAFGHNITGFYAAESGLNKGMGEFKNLFLDFRVPTGGDFSARTSTVGTRTVTYTLTERSGNPRTHTIPTGELFGGLNTTEYTYTVTSQANSKNNDNEASVGAEFLVGNIPIFQFVAFYARDLEILPGAEMHLHGRVHTNAELYLNSDAAAPSGTPPAAPNVTLGGGFFIEDSPAPPFPAPGITNVQVSAKGDLHRGRKNNNNCNGSVYVAKLGDSNSDGRNDPRIINCVGGASSVIPVSTLSAWQGSIVTQLESISVPQPDLADQNGSYWQHADLRIVLRLNSPDSLPGGPLLPHAIEVQDASGVRDVVLTNRLHLFMMDGVWNNTGANSAYKGTMPIFYSERPGMNGVAGCTCTDANAIGCNNQVRECYNFPVGSPYVAANFPLPAGAVGTNYTRAYSPLMNAQNIPSVGAVAFNSVFDGNYRRGGFYNFRERQWLYLLNINIGDLLAWNQDQVAANRLFAPGDTSNGGLIIYATVVDANDPNPVDPFNSYGVRLFGGENLDIPVAADPTGLTFVTEQPVYVLGDYNGNTDGAGASVVGALPWQPAAIIADSVNVLSNDWFNRNGATAAVNSCTNDCQSIAALGDTNRRAAHTTFNVAFLGGVDDTVGSAYNGGLENYPRFHESWSSRNMNYRGSFVSLGVPVHANGAWPGTGGVFYNPPIRNYDYDPRFNNAANLPPDTPRFVYVQQVLFTEDFK